MLFHLEGKSRLQIAETLQCTTGTVKALLERARAKLRNQLVHHGIPLATILAVVSKDSAYAASGAQVSEPLIQSTIECCQGLSPVPQVGLLEDGTKFINPLHSKGTVMTFGKSFSAVLACGALGCLVGLTSLSTISVGQDTEPAKIVLQPNTSDVGDASLDAKIQVASSEETKTNEANLLEDKANPLEDKVSPLEVKVSPLEVKVSPLEVKANEDGKERLQKTHRMIMIPVTPGAKRGVVGQSLEQEIVPMTPEIKKAVGFPVLQITTIEFEDGAFYEFMLKKVGLSKSAKALKHPSDLNPENFSFEECLVRTRIDSPKFVSLSGESVEHEKVKQMMSGGNLNAVLLPPGEGKVPPSWKTILKPDTIVLLR